MKTSRPMRLLTTFVAILSMLFMQHAAAAYLCPGAPLSGNNQAASMHAVMTAMPDMPGCTGMDTDQSTLCHVYTHGDAARQTLDKVHGADLPPFIAIVVPLLWMLVDAPILQESRPPSDVALARSTAPPIAIRHCCFRI
ncbi:hypothetical protein ACQ4WQ_10970 [Janthinobacterium sp. GB1R12]|uniref:hypothetical protein n=1 Tax=Janthinobacterium sp. GB1R12 TaxID=3424190 RepID=UPI003F21E10D